MYTCLQVQFVNLFLPTPVEDLEAVAEIVYMFCFLYFVVQVLPQTMVKSITPNNVLIVCSLINVVVLFLIVLVVYIIFSLIAYITSYDFFQGYNLPLLNVSLTVLWLLGFLYTTGWPDLSLNMLLMLMFYMCYLLINFTIYRFLKYDTAIAVLDLFNAILRFLVILYLLFKKKWSWERILFFSIWVVCLTFDIITFYLGGFTFENIVFNVINFICYVVLVILYVLYRTDAVTDQTCYLQMVEP